MRWDGGGADRAWEDGLGTVASVTSGVLDDIGPIAYGCWRFAGTDVATAREKIETALDCGMTLIDTADIYG